jgi:hypothetical protein
MFQRFQRLSKGLKNFLLFKYSQLGKYQYPVSILPKAKYKKEINLDLLIADQDLYVLRRSDKTAKETFTESGFLYEDVLLQTNVPNMSMNILGRLFKAKYIKFRPLLKTNGGKDWDGNYSPKFSDLKNDFEKLKIYSPIFFKGADLNNIEIPCSREINNDSKNLMKQLKIKPDEEDGNFILKGQAKLKHSPINLNYWHIELVITDYKKVPKKIMDISNTWNFDATYFLLTHILTIKALKEIPLSIPIISTNHYCQ